MTEQPFVDGSFTAPRERRQRLTAALLEHLPREAGVRLLDLGCGNGLQLLDLADSLPHADLSGIDTSRVNVEAARARVAGSPHAQRISLLEGDYLELDTGPFDVILADSVLQNIAAPDARLYPKLADDICAGGMLIASIPYQCISNRLLWYARRGLRAFRGQYTDRLALGAARRLHPQWDRALLEERIPYLYMIPKRIDDVSLVTSLARFGLERIAAESLPRASLAQPKHRVSVFRKRSAP